MRVAVTTLGCKTNQYESASIREALARDGYEVVRFDMPAEVYIINTCTVTARTDAESRKLIRRAKRLNPHGRIVVTGCYAQVSAQEVDALEGVDLVVGNREKKQIPALLRAAARGVVVGDPDGGGTLPLETHAEHTRAFLQVQNGCNSFCSYCIVPFARGRSRSVPLQEVLGA
ncbi:MAG TPA: tRNA (N(6)-L-threonylcarbamoyladenosine(37)-C(2))-methylthiotransferase MtaB, partial [Verrucomicrobiae bacterium]|nr:tRNA (N(6)-L-threonylcarbamoyladenosine(37)-C(2))-methylthiotransferase MtaB [Verrucomicrobiae bacterium]